jgi:hypothetical protein
MGFTQDLLTDVRQQLAPSDDVLKEARARRDLVRNAALTFTGMQRTFTSGSLAHATANCPIHKRDKGLDADCGGVLTRVTHRDLGPDSSSGEGPASVVGRILDHIRPAVLDVYSAAALQTTKRAIFIEFNAPLPGGEDPTVDLVAALERKEAPGLASGSRISKRTDGIPPIQKSTRDCSLPSRSPCESLGHEQFAWQRQRTRLT